MSEEARGRHVAGLVARYASHLMQAKAACLVGVFVLAGVPGMMEVCEHLAAGEVNPHVLMMLSALGTIVLGKAFEVCSMFNCTFPRFSQLPRTSWPVSNPCDCSWRHNLGVL